MKIIESFLTRHGLLVKKNELFFFVCRFKNIELVMSLENGEIRVSPNGFENFPANMKFFDYDWQDLEKFNSALDEFSEETDVNVHSSSLKIHNHGKICENINKHLNLRKKMFCTIDALKSLCSTEMFDCQQLMTNKLPLMDELTILRIVSFEGSYKDFIKTFLNISSEKNFEEISEIVCQQDRINFFFDQIRSQVCIFYNN